MALDYASIYAQNEQAYQQSLQGYQNQVAQNAAVGQQTLAGYQNRYNASIGMMSGANQSNLQDIQDQYRRAQGTSQQNLISRGLGNTTVQDATNRGLQADATRQTTLAQNDYAQRVAGMGAQLSGDTLNYQNTLGQQQAGLYGQIASLNQAHSQQALQYQSQQDLQSQQLANQQALARQQQLYGTQNLYTQQGIGQQNSVFSQNAQNANNYRGIGSYGIGSMGSPGSAYGGANTYNFSGTPT